MAIRTVVTRGFGNGTFNGTIALVTLRGFIAGAAVDLPSGGRNLTTGITKTTDSVYYLALIENAMEKFLVSLDCPNFHSGIPPATTQEQLADLLFIYDELDQHFLEGWFLSRPNLATTSKDYGTSVEYEQLHHMQLIGMTYRGSSLEDSYIYMQEKTEQLIHTMQKNINFAMGDDAVDVEDIMADLTLEPFSIHGLYRTEMTFTIRIRITETQGRIVA